jgi:DNA-binding MarR family transcriptional regulator
MTDEPRPPFSPVIALLTLGRTAEADLADRLKPLGLTVRSLGLLGHIARQPGVSFSELARRSRITVQSAHTAVQKLVSDGLVSDTTANAGQRSTLELSAAGRTVLDAAMAAVAALDAELFPASREPLSDALRRDLLGG